MDSRSLEIFKHPTIRGLLSCLWDHGVFLDDLLNVALTVYGLVLVFQKPGRAIQCMLERMSAVMVPSHSALCTQLPSSSALPTRGNRRAAHVMVLAFLPHRRAGALAPIALGSRVVPLDSLDPRLIGMVFTKNGDVVATGAGAAALGDPLAAVAWLANTLAPRFRPSGLK